MSGLGEKFSPDLFTGTGNFTVPIALPGGRNGFQPELSLAYSTGYPNGPFGLGWSASVPAITRKTSKGIPLYDEETDTFVLAGKEDLVRVPGSPAGATSFRLRTEGLFARIRRYQSLSADYWEVAGKDGIVSFYGLPGAPEEFDPAAILHPDRGEPFAWKLSASEDTFGNRIEYEYLPRDEPWEQLYLDRIRYLDYTDAAGETQFLVTVEFEYEDRPDVFSDRRAGFELRTTKRCSEITVYTHNGTTRRTRSYGLRYADDLEEDAAPLNGVSLLRELRVVGRDGDQTEELPPLEFGYTAFDPASRTFFPLEGQRLPRQSLAAPELELVDLSSDGLPDVLEANGAAIRYWRNRGNGRFDAPRPMINAPAGLRIGQPGTQLIDADGDGAMDVLVTSGPINGYFPLQRGGGWSQRAFRPYQAAPSFALDDQDVKLMDIDGDGVTDAVRSGSSFEIFFNDPVKGWSDVRRVPRGRLDGLADVSFADPRVQSADMTGDGLQDVVLVHDGNVRYWPSLGRGDWGRAVTMRNSPSLPYGYDPRRVLVGDIDGDGLADLVLVESRSVTVWVNQSGAAWSAPKEIHGTPRLTNADDVRLVDLLGCGVSGLLWSRDAEVAGAENYLFLDLTGGTKPHLLNEMDNNMGARTSVAYSSSTRFLVEDEKDGNGWQTTLPFPVQVVARVDIDDFFSRSKLTTQLRYHHGYWDGPEREFHGFARVDQNDTQNFERFSDGEDTAEQAHYSPPLETRTWFHQGAVGDEFGDWEELDLSSEFWAEDAPLLGAPPSLPSKLSRRAIRDGIRTLRGSILRNEVYALDGSELETRPVTVAETLYAVATLPLDEALPEPPAQWQKRVFFPHKLAERTTRWERGDDPSTQVRFFDDYDAFGQVRQETTVALPRRSARRSSISAAVAGQLAPDETQVLARHSRTGYATPDPTAFPDLYLHSRTAHSKVFELTEPEEVDETDADELAAVLADQVAAARAGHERFQELLDQWVPGESLPDGVRLVAHDVNHYDGDADEAFEGLPAGEVGPFGALTRSESLVLTDAILDEAYGSRRPQYLGGTQAPPAGSPNGFGSGLGYRLKTTADAGYHNGYYADTSRRRFDFHEEDLGERRGLSLAVQDAMGNRTTIEPDEYWLFPARIVDPFGLETEVGHDYRVLQPESLTDPNGSTTLYRFSPLGLLSGIVATGQDGEGGTEAKPDTEWEHDLTAYYRTRDSTDPQPVFFHTRRRVQHASESASDEVLEARAYWDGFGRILQQRTKAEELVFGTGEAAVFPAQEPGRLIGERDAARVAVSGWQAYDNKGRVVERYEPFFSSEWSYEPEEEAKRGVCAVQSYDALGRLVKTIAPDGSEERFVFGALSNLKDLDGAAPNPWEKAIYDANDLAPDSVDPDGPADSLSAAAPEDHHHTPGTHVHDALGRVVCEIKRNGRAATDAYATRREYDQTGNVVAVFDEHGREAFAHVYDLRGAVLSTISIDAGWRTSVFDATGKPVEYRDDKGNVALREYDAVGRPKRVWAADSLSAGLTLRQEIVYGEEGDQTAAREVNALGRAVRQLDEAGLVRFDRYDFKGNVAEQTRQVVSDAALARGWVVDWSDAGASAALGDEYTISVEHDALSRPIEIRYPECVSGPRPVLTATYNRAGALERAELDGVPFLRYLGYNARGQRVVAAFGNGELTRYAYDERTFRLVRLRTEKAQPAGSSEWTLLGTPIQDIRYKYDLVGNPVSADEQIPFCGIGSTQNQLVRTFGYDALYRVERADGRACRTAGCGFYPAPFAGPPFLSQANAPAQTEAYSETYEYDPAGNLLELTHMAGGTTARRTFSFGGATAENWDESESNHLTGSRRGSAEDTYTYDANGNLASQNTERLYDWDHVDRLAAFAIQPAGATSPSIRARYLYDAEGARVKKWVQKNGTTQSESTVYIAGIFEHFRDLAGAMENNRLHVMDGDRRVAVVRRGPPQSSRDGGPPVEYHFPDLVGSSTAVVDGTGGWVNREEYTPFGETTFGGFARKRYRFSGRERDEESGLQYHRARYYAPWLARWLAVDPSGTVDELNLYLYARNNPLRFVDPTGEQAQAQEQQSFHDVARGIMEQSRREHLEAIAESGIGRYYGSRSTWAYSPETRRVPEGAAEPESTNCIEWPLEILGEAFGRFGASRQWEAIEAEVRQETTTEQVETGRASVLARLLREKGWTTTYYNRDVRMTRERDYNVPAALVKRRGYYPAVPEKLRTLETTTGGTVDITTPVDDTLLNFAPMAGSATKRANRGAYKELLKVPFAIGFAKSGYHTFVLSSGRAWEVHWDSNPSDPKLIEVSSFAQFIRDWPVGLVVVPPPGWAPTPAPSEPPRPRYGPHP